MSEVTPFEVKDYLTIARGRVTEQFKDKDVFDRYIQLLIYGSQQLQEVIKDLIQKRSIDTAEGVNLDIIGKIVGLERGSLPAEVWNTAYFGFIEDTDALSFDDLDSPISDAGVFFDLANETEGNVLWDDITYRLFLKARIFANCSNGTPEELITATKSILNVTSVDIIELGDAHMLLGFNRILNNVEKYILQGLGEQQALLPIPIGVSVEYIESPEDFFGFEETSGALGFSDLVEGTYAGYGESYGAFYGAGGSSGTTPVGGGTFASIF